MGIPQCASGGGRYTPSWAPPPSRPICQLDGGKKTKRDNYFKVNAIKQAKGSRTRFNDRRHKTAVVPQEFTDMNSENASKLFKLLILYRFIRCWLQYHVTATRGPPCISRALQRHAEHRASRGISWGIKSHEKQINKKVSFECVLCTDKSDLWVKNVNWCRVTISSEGKERKNPPRLYAQPSVSGDVVCGCLLTSVCSLNNRLSLCLQTAAKIKMFCKQTAALKTT